jgi:hypothetical protein
VIRTATALVLVLAFPAAASAQKCVARPGTAALDQYCETVPTGKGPEPARQEEGRLGSALPAQAVEKLESHGKDGEAVLALPTGGTPRPPSGSAPSGTQPLSSASAKGSAGTESDAPPDAPSSNPVSAAFTALGGVGALGWGLLLALVAVAVVAGAAAFSARHPARDLPPSR